MKYLKLYEYFVQTELQNDIDVEQELSDKTIDDVMSGDFFNDIEYDDNEESSSIDKNGVCHIKNWNIY